jgi:hypothetical protein
MIPATDADQPDAPPLPFGPPGPGPGPLTFEPTGGKKFKVVYADGGFTFAATIAIDSGPARRGYVKDLRAAARATRPDLAIDGGVVAARIAARAALPAPEVPPGGAGPGAEDDGFPRLRNYVEDAVEGRTGTVRQALNIAEIAGDVAELVPDKFKRVDDQVFVASADHGPIYVDRKAQLFSILAEDALVEWDHTGGYVGQDEFLEYIRRSAPNYRSIETMPHEPPMAGMCYMHPDLPAPGGKLDGLVAMFSPLTELDRDLIKGLIVSAFWGGPPGGRPCWLITGPPDDPRNGVEVGKTRLVDIVADELGGGSLAVGANEDMATVKTRLLSPSGRQLRFLRLDNVKSLRFSWADLEDLITAPELSGRQLYKGEGRRPNTLTATITLNGGSLSKDMASRVNVIKLARPEKSPTWERDTRAYAAAHRWEIVADIVELLKREVPVIRVATRRADWEQSVLARVTADLAGCQALLLARQDELDADDGEKADVRDYFVRRLEEHGYDPETCHIRFTSLQAAEWLTAATRKHYATNTASAELARRGIAELKNDRTKTKRGWVWKGEQCKATEDDKPQVLTEAAQPGVSDCGNPRGQWAWSRTSDCRGRDNDR